MPATLRLTVLTGDHKDEKFCFCGASSCLIGRGSDCFIQLTGTERDQLISRHHCQLKIDLPAVHIKDLGSRNGTYLNGKLVESLEVSLAPCECDAGATRPAEILTVGGTTLRVDVVDCKGDSGIGWKPGEMARKGCAECHA
jgi:hypothetical protein